MSSGFLLIISAPSGTGKSTVCRRLLDRNRSLKYSVSCTTRPPRPGEFHGRHYRFLSTSAFRALRRRDALLEWAVVHGSFYGTPRRRVEKLIRAGDVVLADIDVQGAAKVRRRLGEKAVAVFLLPPSWKQLERRLRKRRDTDAPAIRRRLADARSELSRAGEYRYWIVNDDLSTAVRQIESVIAAERLRAGRQGPLAARLRD
ncbi:MAG: guanylate kinase [Elusimicrobia bacterium]|nr:guanylate kinase [Elusimicrobiota bacterium]